MENSIYKFYLWKEENGKKICECLRSCNAGKYEYFKEYLDDCTSGSYKETNKWLKKCNSNFYYKNEITGVYKCKANCDGDNSQNITSNYECVSRCPINENFIGTIINAKANTILASMKNIII